MSSTAFIGLGVMGFPMAGHLAGAGHDVCVFNRTTSKAEAWLARHAGEGAATPRAAASGAEFVFTCVGNDDDLRAVLLDGPEAVIHGAAPGTVCVDHSTTSARVAREVAARLAERDIAFLDAPVSGGQAGAENGLLTVMCGGDEAVFARVRPVIEAYARACTLLGPSGSGQLAKMVNQVCVAGVLQGLAEALDFGRRAGLDLPRVLEVISKGAAQSWQMDNRGLSMCEGRYDFGFAVDWMRKDLGIVLEEGAGNGAALEVTRLIDGYYAEVQAMGGGRWDTSSLLERLSGG